MRNIYDKDGLSREKRLEHIAGTLPIQVLEDRFSVLLDRFMHKDEGDFTSIYKYQPLIILAEIGNFDVSSMEKTYRHFHGKDEKSDFVCGIIACIEDWRKRLEFACINTTDIKLLTELNEQIQTNISPFLPVYQSLYHVKITSRELGYVWFSAKPKTLSDIVEKGFQRRFLFLLLSSIEELRRNIDSYRNEILSSGTVDPSLAVIVAFLHNYSEIASRFNERWQKIPFFYLDKILHAEPRKKNPETIWIPYKNDSPEQINYQLLSEPVSTSMKIEKMEMIVAEKRRERYPEAALNYITGLLQSSVPGNSYIPSLIGFQLHSGIFLLNEGERTGTITCKITDESADFLANLIHKIAYEENIVKDEALFKILFDSFLLEATTSDGWEKIKSYTVKYHSVEKELLFVFYLDNNFPSVEPFPGTQFPGIRIMVNASAWLFPYSWTRMIFIESIHIKVEVKDVRNVLLYNELGLVDSQRPFVPFGTQTGRGAWMGFGNYEMAIKHLTNVDLSFNWLNLPVNKNGLKEYYAGYESKIDNNSFRVRTDYLQDYKWKTKPGAELHSLFNATLSDHATISFSLPEYEPLQLGDPGYFQPGNIPSGLFRIVLETPEMGFGEKEYRRLFTEVMIKNSRRRKPVLPPEPPISPLMDAPRLNYSAEEECFFAIGETPSILLSYISPLSYNAALAPDPTRPVALIEGPEDEGNLMISISGASGENIISMYIEMELLQREIDHNFLPEISWYYKNGGQWAKIHPSGILRDETGYFMHSGAVEIQLPFAVTTDMLDADGLFWLCACTKQNLCNCSIVKNISLSIVQVKAINCEEAKDTEDELRIRISERISHRNRAILPQDYEQMILADFPEILKVKCLPGVDAKEQERQALVTLVLIGNDANSQWPLCEDRLLCDVEDYLRQYVSPFVEIDAINPVYEEVTVFCGITIKKGKTTGAAISDVNRIIKNHIAPWTEKDKLPVFNYSFSLRDLEGHIKESPFVESLHGIKIIHLTKDRQENYTLNEYISRQTEDIVITPSQPWMVLVPAIHQYVIICAEDEWEGRIEYGDLELEQTFVIK